MPRTVDARAATIDEVLARCADDGPRPARSPAPGPEWIADVSYERGTWPYHAVLALLGRRAPRDLLTGERLEVEQLFGKRLQGHHLFPRKWCAEHPDVVPDERVDSVVNIAPLTGYTNAWISARAPSEYLAGIRAVVGDHALRDLLRGHLIEPDLLEGQDFAGFWSDRLRRIHELLVAAVE